MRSSPLVEPDVQVTRIRLSSWWSYLKRSEGMRRLTKARYLSVERIELLPLPGG